MSQIDINYHRLLSVIMENGYNYETQNRPGVVCRQLSSVTIEVTLEKFPLLTTKKMYWKGIVAELIWFLRGDNNIKFLLENDVHIWDKDAYNWYTKMTKAPVDMEEFLKGVKEGRREGLYYTFGDVGRNYGSQWRKWTEVDEDQNEVLDFDQIGNLLKSLSKNNPINRRHIVTAWNPAEVDQTALPPCHWAFEIIPRPLTYTDRIGLCHQDDQEHLAGLWEEMSNGNEDAKEKLSKSLAGIPKYAFTLKWHQRSVDTFLGLPFNLASYALLAHFIGLVTEMLPLELIADLSNVHLYQPHFDVVKEQLERSPMEYGGPEVHFSDRLLEDIVKYKKGKLLLFELFNNMEIEDFTLFEYKSFGKLKADMFEPKE